MKIRKNANERERSNRMMKTGKVGYAASLAGVLLCACLLLTACEKKNVDSENNISGESSVNVIDNAAAAPTKEWVYVPEIVTLEDDRARYGDMQLVGDTVCYISMAGEAEGEEQKLCRYSLTDGELTQVPFQWTLAEKNLEICSYVFQPDCSVWLIVNAYSADYGQLNRYLCRFDPEGKNLVSQDITGEMGRGSYVGDMAVDGQGGIYVFTSEYAEGEEAGIWLYTGEGSYQGSLSFGTSNTVLVKGTVRGQDGRFYVCISQGENPDHCTMLEVDFEGKRITEAIGDFPDINGLCMVRQPGGDSGGQAGSPVSQTEGAASSDVTPESGKASPGGTAGDSAPYDLLLYDDKYVYGYNFSSHENGSGQTLEELLTWPDSDINGYFVENLSILEDGRFYVAVEDWTNRDRCIVLLQKTKGEDVVPKKVLTLAAVNGGSSLTALAVRFNRSQEQYHLDIKDYDSLTELYQAILTREPMDLIDLSGVNVESLCRQGIFEDLRPYLEQAERFAPSDFVEGVLDTYTVSGTLVGIPDSFSLKTMVGDRTLLGGDTGLTLQGLFDIAERNPNALPVGEVTKDEMMQYLMMFNQDVFIDWETGECSFDSEQFKAVLELVNRFPDSVDTEKEEESLPAKIANGSVLFAVADFHSLGNFQRYEGMFGEMAACVGFPTPEREGGTILFPTNAFGITSMSQCKEGAWKFIESVLEPGEIEKMEPRKVYESYEIPNARFPSLKRILDIIIEYELEEDRQWAEKGRKFGYLTYSDGWVIEFHALKREEIDIILDQAKEARPYFSAEGDEVIKIIGEEAASFYSGQKGAEDVMRTIQNRVRLYVNENR